MEQPNPRFTPMIPRGHVCGVLPCRCDVQVRVQVLAERIREFRLDARILQKALDDPCSKNTKCNKFLCICKLTDDKEGKLRSKIT